MQLGFIFPGQGSQSLSMLNDLSDIAIVKQTFIEASDIIGVDLLAMLANSEQEQINQTVNTQPLMLASGVASYRLWCQLGGCLPDVMAGHSLGEYTALVCSGSLEFASAVKLVQQRAKLMQQASQDGAMAAVLGLADASVIEICQQASSVGVVEAVNFNAPAQVVIAGTAKAVAYASELLVQHGAKKVVALAVSVPAHCSLMYAASVSLAEILQNIDFAAPQCTVLFNYTAQSYTSASDIRQALVKQLYSPVLWRQTIAKINDMGINNLVECGAGRVLTGLNKRIQASLTSYNLNKLDDFTALLELKK